MADLAAFTLHPLAQILGPSGAAVSAAAAASIIDPAQGASAIHAALAQGGGVRIGLPQAPAPATDGFETLTSGSTGTPRRIHRSIASWTRSFAVHAQLFNIGPGRRVAVLGSLEHSLSLYGAMEAACLGAELHLLAGLRADRQSVALAERAVELLYATPAQLRGLAEPMPELRLVLVGGSKLDAALRAHLHQLAPQADVREFYGAAEASFITLADAQTPEASVGRAYPGVEIDIRNGEVWVKSPYLFNGYASDPGGAHWHDGWLSVGEMGRLQGGELYLHGRKGRMVTVADHNVFPEEIEALMETLPGVQRAAILAEPDPKRGHVLHAVVQGDPAQEAALMAALRAQLGAMKAPRSIRFLTDWPVTSAGKTDLAAVRGLR
ncbi:AMP-binding protein [Xinfangfangia sp. CPCC 101601]|uniref:AMP-binding protein n=1 Tax=Pseudogemmobacter lacusdianii TaxID=3069608 RepID=A0ABU0VT61_9RHOB|nr:AMP-binding protein [Xinfangfangia sp. CPCC 101601]MDQ2064910.1 AMP-binding protein [Xinfangfangia sp. CPCC 101601]